jgi:dienelactone hydrolase
MRTVLFGSAAIILMLLPVTSSTSAANPPSAANRILNNYFKSQTEQISSACLNNIETLADWQARRPELRREAAEMLGLDPLPEKNELKPVITGTLEKEDFIVEKLYFQSSPHLYVTANLYLPRHITRPVPAVLYLCGHTEVLDDGVSCGNKTAYQQHGIWFARNGYACLIIDTLQYGEILGDHRGTYDEGQWWWNSRGYTPAGVETWDAIRALDYLDTRPEVDTNRIGVTGRSGGGAYSWFLAALDDRVKVIAPVAGMTDLKSYVVDGTVENHCDCMFLVNTYRWDYPTLAALCAPRPLLIENSDADALFPLTGVMRLRDKVKQIYDLYGAATNLGLVITPGPHRDTQDLQMPVFHWFNLHLKHEDPVIAMAAVKMFSPQELKVFAKIPRDQINTRIQESFEPEAEAPKIPATAMDWKMLKENWMKELKEKSFAGWPADAKPPRMTRLFSRQIDGVIRESYSLESQPNVPLSLDILRPTGNAKPQKIILRILDGSFTEMAKPAEGNLNQPTGELTNVFETGETMSELAREIKQQNIVAAFFAPRGIGPEAWSGDAKAQTQLRRRFMLLGQTLAGMRVWDIHRAVQALRSDSKLKNIPLVLEANNKMAVNALYASLFQDGISQLRLGNVPSRQSETPDYLNVLKIVDVSQVAAMAADRCELQMNTEDVNGWKFLRAMSASPIGHLKLRQLKQRSTAFDNN